MVRDSRSRSSRLFEGKTPRTWRSDSQFGRGTMDGCSECLTVAVLGRCPCKRPLVLRSGQIRLRSTVCFTLVSTRLSTRKFLAERFVDGSSSRREMPFNTDLVDTMRGFVKHSVSAHAWIRQDRSIDRTSDWIAGINHSMRDLQCCRFRLVARSEAAYRIS